MIYFIFIVLIGVSAFFSASETAIFSLSALKLRKISERYPQAKTVKILLKKPTHLLSAIVLGNLMVNIGISSLATAVFVGAMGEKGLVPAILLSGFFILLFGEVFPKTFAIYAAEKVSMAFSPALLFFSKIFLPFITVIEKVTAHLSSFIVQKPKESRLNDEEFKDALLLSKRDGQISAQEEEMVSNVLEFKDTKASEILTARIDIKGIDVKLSQERALETMRLAKHSKFPVFEGSLDNIIGVLYAKDVFLSPETDYREFLREPIFIPESKGIDDILKLFLEKKERAAVVLDEHGGTEGLITLEDIIEEIFGEIYDEFEKIQEPVEKIGENKYRIYGKTAVKAVNSELSLNLPEDEDNVAGFLLSRIERIPKAGEKISFSPKTGLGAKKAEFVVERASARRIVSVIVEIKR